MWSWITTAWEGVKGLFGGKGTVQIGKGNQSATVGNGGTVNQIAGDVHHHQAAPEPVKDEDAEMFVCLEETMPDLLNVLRLQLAEQPLIRNLVIVSPRVDAKNYSTNWIKFSVGDNQNIHLQLKVLENNELVRRVLKEGQSVVFSVMYQNAFVMTEKLVRYLKKGKASPDGSGTGG
jgi:hypothetical protein